MQMGDGNLPSLFACFTIFRSAFLGKEAFKTGKTVREVCLEWNVLPPEKLDEVLDPWKMIKPTV